MQGMTSKQLANQLAKELYDDRDMDYVVKNKRCIQCQQEFFLVSNFPVNKSLVPEDENRKGLVYSDSGMAETGISGLCEFCFDKLFE